MDAIKERMRMNDERQTITALFPTLSIVKPRSGQMHAEMIYGIPNKYPA